MYGIGEKIVYGIKGVFVISDIREENVLGSFKTYYVLKSLRPNSESLVFVPVDNEKLVSSIRYVMTESEAKELIKKIPNIAVADWYPESRKRSDYYNDLIESPNRENIISVIKSIWLNNEKRKNAGKKSYISDENTLRKAENILHEELAIALGIEEKDLKEFIKSAVEN